MGCDDEERIWDCIDFGVMEMCGIILGMGNFNCLKGKGVECYLLYWW